MTQPQLRIMLNALAGILGSGGVAALALGHPVIALGLTNAVAFLAAWANMTKPGDIAITKLPPEVQAAVSYKPPPDSASDDRETPPTPPPIDTEAVGAAIGVDPADFQHGSQKPKGPA